MTQARRPGRPAISSAEEIQRHAMGLFVRRGFDQTSMAQVAEAAGVGRTTLFRYFPSKAAIVWADFDGHIRRLAQLLAAQPRELPVMTAVHLAVVQAFAEAVDDRDLWRQRFQVLQETAALAGEVSVRWSAWARTVADHVAATSGGRVDDVAAAAVGGAVQAAFVATLRDLLPNAPGEIPMNAPGEYVVTRMREALQPICDGLTSLVE